ncbi:MAG TPA: DUF1553 domain-containing protein, partial [Planctomycetota bacterium]|nr:DUF1553 domain-containing protein [Planctomycetota bacterium]
VVERPAPTTHLLARGEPDLKREVVEPGVLSAIGGALESPSPRAAFARWLTDVDRGAGRLLARVVVNRVWQHHFGVGLVATPDDFGTQGEPPAHPELLDALAARLIENRWSLKSLHRLILGSAAYRQARPPRRLDAEALRDALLAVGGRLDAAKGGPSVKSRVPKEAILTRSKDAYPADAPESLRRGLYLFRKRSVPLPFLEIFDAPAPTAGCGRRDRSTVAPQALLLLNDPFVRECAKGLAARAGGDPVRAWRLALGRPPRPAELAAVVSLPFEDLCHALLLTNEFAYVD